MNHAPTTAGLYTYKAHIERVIDGDTIKVQIDLGFDIWNRQTLRLRGIDAFELNTGAGKRGKEFVEAALKHEPFVTIKTSREDKYDRYLADVFYGRRQMSEVRSQTTEIRSQKRARSNLISDLRPLSSESKHLNQRLLDEKLAVRV
jgi:endonuclease YncB( thermonuclease family)